MQVVRRGALTELSRHALVQALRPGLKEALQNDSTSLVKMMRIPDRHLLILLFFAPGPDSLTHSRPRA